MVISRSTIINEIALVLYSKLFCMQQCFSIIVKVNNCIFHFRLCSLTITRLSLLAPLPSDLTSLSLAVKMQSSKRTLRSHEISVGQSIFAVGGAINTTGVGANSTPFGGNGTALLETELDLHFSLQYPHFLKRDGNR